MKRIVIISFVCFLFANGALAQNGSGCRRAATLTPGIFTVDTMFMGAAAHSDIFPFPDRAIWYRYTAQSDGVVTVSSCGGGSDTRLFMYVGTCDTLLPAGFDDDYCEVDSSGEILATSLSKPVKAGKTYFFEWDNAWDDAPFTFTFSVSAFNPGPTQACQTASTVNPGVIKVDSLFGYASRGDAARANWYKYTPTRSGRISIATCGQDVDTRLWVYRGTCSALSLIADSDDDCFGQIDTLAVSIADLSVTAGTTYFLEWDDAWDYLPFDFTLSFNPTSAVEDPNFAKGVSIAPNPASDALTLSFDFDQTTAVRCAIANAVGQIVEQRNFGSVLRGSETLDITHLQPGVYIVQISDGERRTNKKLVIQR